MVTDSLPVAVAAAPTPTVSRVANKVAIVGFCENTRGRAPFKDPAFEVWGCNHLYPYLPKRDDGSEAWDRWFDVHSPEWSAQYLHPKVWAEHSAWLAKDHGRPIYMQAHYADMPCSVPYPVAEVTERMGRAYFTSAIAYQLALAICEGFEEIHLFGVDLRHDTEYGQQRPCAEYWLGRAEGEGIKVWRPDESAILSCEGLYGFDEIMGAWAEMDRHLGGAVTEAEAAFARERDEADKHTAAMQTWDGARQFAAELRLRVRQRARGGQL